LIDLFHLDERICSTARNIIKQWITCDSKSVKHKKARREQIQLSGSCAEGGMVSRFFQDGTFTTDLRNIYHVDGVNREAEFDLEFTILDLTPNLKDLVVEIPERPGYVRLREHSEFLANMQSLGWDVNEKHKLGYDRISIGMFYEDDYVRTYNLKAYFINKVGSGLVDDRCSNCLRSLIAGALKKPRSDFLIEFAMAITNATGEVTMRIKMYEKKFFKICYDCVPMIKLLWWPEVANEWKDRQRVWPSESVIRDLTRVGYIIGKPQKKEDRNATDLRYAFSHVEHQLVNMRNKRQKMIYLIFKITWVKYVKPIDPEKISSFMAKTVMFWVCEEIHPDNAWWKREYTEILKDIFQRMSDSFEEGFLPYYFIPHINILRQVPLELIDNEIKPQLQKIINRIDDYVPKSFGEIMTFAKTVLETFEPVCKAFDDFKKRDYTLFVRQPELIVPQLSYLIRESDLKILQTIRETLEGTDHIKDGFLRDETYQVLVARWKDITKKRFWVRESRREVSRRRMIEKILAEIF